MPISFQPASSAAVSLRSEPLLSPPLSHHSSEEVPFRAEDDDPVSLSMKKNKKRRRGRRRLPPDDGAGWSKNFVVTNGRRTLQGRTSDPGLPLRRTRSQPVISQPFVPGTVELSPRTESRARRWTVASKATPTRALATVVTIREANVKRSSKKAKSSLSPAMITLRRATASESQHRMSLTSFPPPKFGRRSSGLLSTIFNTIKPTLHGPSTTSGASSQTKVHKPASISAKHSEVCPGTSSIAPAVYTEVVTSGPRLSISGRTYTPQSGRRCSTRYFSDDEMYEIIWDQTSSSSASEGAAPTPPSREWDYGSRGAGGTEALERRLSNILTRSRRTSVQAETSRRGSWWPGSEAMYAQGFLPLLESSPKLARLAREAAFRNLPRSKASNTTLNAATLPLAVSQQVMVEATEPRRDNEGVEFFPPLRSRSNTAGSATLRDPFYKAHDETTDESRDQLGLAFPGSLSATGTWNRRRSSYGGMIGASRHVKRRSISAGPYLVETRTMEYFEDGEESQHGHFAHGPDDDAVPLLAGA
ncbi:hypothetical protein ABEF95_009895 [Exophiala dermatitidis]